MKPARPPLHLGEWCMNTWTPRACHSTATSPAARIRSPIDHTCMQPIAYPHVCRCVRCGHPEPPHRLPVHIDPAIPDDAFELRTQDATSRFTWKSQ